MASFQAATASSSSSPSRERTRRIMAIHHAPKLDTVRLKDTTSNMEEELLRLKGRYTTTTTTTTTTKREDSAKCLPTSFSQLYIIADTVADRVEMHTNIGEQRDNWNTLLVTSINTITLTGTIMAALSATTTTTTFLPFPPLNLSSSLLFTAATGLMVVMNKLQPSQLAEEQRNAAKLFKQLHREIQTTLANEKNPTPRDVMVAMKKVSALDRAYPLPLLGAMLDKFPAKVEPACWWPSPSSPSTPPSPPSSPKERRKQILGNGWSEKLEEEMRQIVEVLKRKDAGEYMRLGKLVLKINKILAVSGPLLAGMAAVGSAFVGSSPSSDGGDLALTVSVVAGALATVVNTLEHGGQVGMVFEMYRNSAGFFTLLEESIEANLNQKYVERRENGQSFELKVALNLGRSLPELRDLASHAIFREEAGSDDEFGCKLF